jgi:hypothetical protein
MHMIRKSRHEFPNFKKLSIAVDTERLLACFENWKHEQDSISDHCGTPYLNDKYFQTPITTSSEKIILSNGLEDERSYGELLPEFKNTYVEEVLNMFKSPYTRVRLIVKKPGALIQPHIDYDTTYSVRYYIPLKTNEWSYTAVKGKYDAAPEIQHLPADGSVWFVNPGYLHSAWNLGRDDDIRLVVACNGQDDL